LIEWFGGLGADDDVAKYVGIDLVAEFGGQAQKR